MTAAAAAAASAAGLFLDESGESLQAYFVEFEDDVDETVGADDQLGDTTHLTLYILVFKFILAYVFILLSLVAVCQLELKS